MNAHRIVELGYLMLPVYCANMAAPFSRFWPAWNAPISERWLGSHKTVVGFAFGVAAAMLVTALQYALAWRHSLVDYAHWPLLGFSCGFGALAGDSIKSLVKRRLDKPPGTRWIPADQLDFIAGGLLGLSPWMNFGWRDVAAIAAVSFIGDILVNQLAFRLGIRDTAW